MPRRARGLLTFVVLLTGCVSLGPRTIRRDRFDYVQALRQSWKEEMLLNIVGLRYVELPVFLQVTSVINQYRLEGTLEGTLGTGEDSATLGGSISNQPTITYVPLAGEAFTRELLTPVSPASVVSMLQSGWPASLVFRTAVRSINGIGTKLGAEEDERFLGLVEHLERIQQARGIGMKVELKEAGQLVVLFFPTNASAEVEADLLAVQTTLGLPPGEREFRLVYGQAPSAPNEIAILTRSAIELLIELGAHVEVPAEDVAAGRTMPTRKGPSMEGQRRLIRVVSGPEQPDDAFVSVRFRGHWFWIEDDDLHSKRMLSFAMLVMSLTAGGASGAAPMVTVSAGS